MDTPAPGAAYAESPTAPDFSTFAREADARDLGRSSDSGAHDGASPTPSPAEQAASTDARTPAASEPATPTDSNAKNLQARKRQVDADVVELKEQIRLAKALREELAHVRTPATAKPASQPAPAPTKAEYQRYLEHPNAPREDDFADYREFVAAMGVFVADQRHEERARSARLEAESGERVNSTKAKIDGFKTQLAKARETDPGFDEKIDARLFDIAPAFTLPKEQIGPANVLIDHCVDSEAAAALLLHFSTPAGQEEWAGLMLAKTPSELIRRFGRIEARFLSDGQQPAGVSPVKTVSTAPAPPTVLGTRPPASPNRAAAALNAGDYRAYQATADAADLAVRRR